MDIMTWVAGVFPLLSLAVGFATKWWLKRAWVGTVIVLIGTYAAFRFYVHMGIGDWSGSWIATYLCLSWLGSWAAAFVVSVRAQKRRLG